MSGSQRHFRRFEALIRAIFAELGGFVFGTAPSEQTGCDLMVSKGSNQNYCFQVKARERITPQTADDLFARLAHEPLPDHGVRVFYAPVISPRVAEIARHHGVSYIDYAGNCRIVDSESGLLISRSGIPNKGTRSKPKSVDPFSPKSSRIVRAMLHEPNRGWQVGELAEHADVRVSVGLVSKVKAALIRESYALVSDRLLYLKRPLDLLTAWSNVFPAPVSQHPFYVRGDTQEVETRISEWCERSNIEYALARFSAAWRLAPEVRYSVAWLYVSPEALQPRNLETLRRECGAKSVESGENLNLLIPYDQSVFVRRTPTPERTTSPLQTYLDLKVMAGRGSEAADAVYEKYIRNTMESVDNEKNRAS